MLGSLGMPELIVIFAIVLLTFGTNRLADLGKGLGQGIRYFKEGLAGDNPRSPEKEQDRTRDTTSTQKD